MPYIQEDRYTDSEVLLSSENVDIFLANLSSWSYADQSSMTAASVLSPTAINQSSFTILSGNCTVSSSKIPVGDAFIYIQDNSSGSWQVTQTTGLTAVTNVSSYAVGFLDKSATSATYTFNVTVHPSGTAGFRTLCTATNANNATSATSTLTITNTPPIITINSVGGDTTSEYTTADETPDINVTLNENATCYLSNVSENYTQMVINNRVNCGSYQQAVAKMCTYSTNLSMGNQLLFMACNDTSGVQNMQPTTMNVTLLCDTHLDCPAAQYCNILQACSDDVIPGYTCSGLAYGGSNDNEVCRTGAGSTALCVNDSSFSFHGWYCTQTDTQCVFNNSGNTFDATYKLCGAADSNDYKVCAPDNTWVNLTDCPDLNDPAIQNATTHPGEYCAYFASAQTCVNGTSGGCTGPWTNCTGHIYAGEGSCGSIFSQCDIGCSAACDSTTNLMANLSEGTCYYDKACNDACTFSQNTEESPIYCINDSDGGTCAWTIRASPATQDVCYFSPICEDGIGANMTSSGMLFADYCDFCNATGNHSGQYSPEPNASCMDSCADEGTLYYDTGLTPTDRSDDCSEGITTILVDTLSLGDIWNGSAPAYCADTECDLDCGTLTGTCQDSACVCNDTDVPTITLIDPADQAWINTTVVTFLYNVTDVGSGVENCSLLIDDVIVNTTLHPIEDALLNFTYALDTGVWNWSITCTDNSSNNQTNTTQQQSVGVDVTPPSLSEPEINDTLFEVNQYVCMHVRSRDVVDDWWDGNWSYRKKITITNTDTVALPDGYTVSITINGAQLISSGKMLSDGSDLRIIYNNGSFISRDWHNETSLSSSSAIISFSTNTSINDSDGNYYFYYGNPSAPAPQTDTAKVYLFYDDFEQDTPGALPSAWTVGSGTWEVYSNESNVLRAQDTVAGYDRIWVTSNPSTWTNVSISFRMLLASGSGIPFGGTLFRRQGTSQDQHLALIGDLRTGTNTVGYRRWDGGYAQIDSDNTAFNTDTWYDFEIRALGDTINMSRDGIRYISNTGPAYWQSGGGLGLLSYSNPLLFDNVIVKKLAGSEPTIFVGAEQNVGLTDESSSSGISSILATIKRPGQQAINITFLDNETTGCDTTNGDGIFSTNYLLIFSGTYNWTKAIAIDNAGNINILAVGLTFTVSAGGELNTTMIAPVDTITINETTGTYVQTCMVTCLSTGGECKNTTLFAQYDTGTFTDITPSTTDLVSNISSYACGNLTSQASTWWNASYPYRQTINITNNEGQDLPAGYTLNISVDTESLVSQDKLQADCDDLRVVYWNGGSNIELDRINVSACNTSTTSIAFKLQDDIPESSTAYALYYGNVSSGTPPQNLSAIYYLFEDFEDQAHDFSQGSLNPTVNGASAHGGSYGLDGYGGASYYRAVTSTTLDSGFLIEGWVMPRTSSTTSLAALTFGANSGCANPERCGYQVLVDQRSSTGGSSPMQIRKDYDSGSPLATSTENSVAANNWYYLKVWWHSNGTITLQVFDASLASWGNLSATDTTYTTGGYGVAAYQYAYWDDIKVSLLSQNPPTVSIEAEQNQSVQQEDNSTCTANFSITAGEGNHTWPVRCKARGSNSATVFSSSQNVSVNDAPYAIITLPENTSWLFSNTTLNASASADSDGSLIAYAWELDNTTAFSSPTTICSSDTCTWNTTLQDQCQNNSLSCYMRLTVTDDLGLSDSTWVLVGIDNAGPTVMLDLPLSFTNSSANDLQVNASASDAGIGLIDMIWFEYRQNDSSSWTSICTDDTPLYDCSWNVSALPDADTYEVRVFANDTLNNTGTADVHTNITLDRTPPQIQLMLPSDSLFTVNPNMTFVYNVTDALSSIQNCSLLINGSVNQTNSSIIPLQPNNFTVDEMADGNYSWTVHCADVLGNENSSATRTFVIDSTGPNATLLLPLAFANITGSETMLNASATDEGIGSIDMYSYEYRENASAAWINACNATQNCSWPIIGLPDGNAYEVRVQANDTLGNLGGYDSHENITIDNNPPNITLLSPAPSTTFGSGDVLFQYVVQDASLLQNCSLIINYALNQTNTSVVRDTTMSFALLGLSNGLYNWSVNCTDVLSFEGQSNQRNFTIDIKNITNISVKTDKPTYEVGDQLAEPILVTSNTTSFYGNPLDTNVTTDIIKGNASGFWWNLSWARRKPILLTNSQSANKTDTTVYMNITELAGNISSCDELRIVSIDLDEVPFVIEDGDGSTWCSIRFTANVTASASNEHNYYVYYDNSAAGSPSYTLPIQGYQLVWEDFEAGSDFLYTAGACPVDGTRECGDSSPWGDFTDCVESEASTAYGICSTNDIAKSGVRGFEARGGLDRNTDNADGLYYDANATACGGQACQDINISYWQAGFSLDTTTPAEGSAVFVNDSDSGLVLISDCMDLEGCEAGVRTAMSASAEFVESNVCEISGINCDSALTFRFTSANVRAHANNDYFAWDAINITGYKRYDPDITSTTASVEEFINRSSTQETGSDGLLDWNWTPTLLSSGLFSAVSLATRPSHYPVQGASTFTLIADQTPPNVTLNDPSSGSESNSSVTFSYKVNDSLSDIANCSLVVDGNIEANSYPPIIEGQVSNFYPRIPIGGTHNWSVNCTDTFGNVGASETWNITIIPPDFVITPGNITFSNTSPAEGQNITIFANIFNRGGSDAENVSVHVYQGDPAAGGVLIDNITDLNITDVSGNLSNVTAVTVWQVPGPGPFFIHVHVDPPVDQNGSFLENNESNNAAFARIDIDAWHIYYGGLNTSIVVKGAESMLLWNASDKPSNIYVTESDANITWTSLRALSRTTSDAYVADDFEEADAALNMTGFLDSINTSFTQNGLPHAIMNITSFDTTIFSIPVRNSTNSSDFETGILWDEGDGNTQYNGSQDLIFVTTAEGVKPGKYGNYSFEISIPVLLRSYKNITKTTVDIYYEIV
ncbi:MAG: DUF2341 domain-containing protein [archaeon]